MGDYRRFETWGRHGIGRAPLSFLRNVSEARALSVLSRSRMGNKV
jgi:hypothetical protein